MLEVGDFFQFSNDSEPEREATTTEKFKYVKRLTEKQARAVQRFEYTHRRADVEISDDGGSDPGVEMRDDGDFSDADVDCSEEKFK